MKKDEQASKCKIEYVYKKPIVTKTVQSGLLLALMFVIHFISSNFFKFPLATYLKFDFTLVLLVICSKYVGHVYTIMLIFIFFAISPSYSSLGYTLQGLLGHSILATIQLVFTSVYIGVFQLLNIKKKLSSKNPSILIGFEVVSLLIALLITTILVTLINVFASTPAFFYLMGWINEPKPSVMHQNISKFKAMFFGINNYYKGALALYLSFNIINISINTILIFSIITLNNKNNFINVHFEIKSKNAKIQKEDEDEQI